MAKQTRRSEALGVAIQMEREGMAFYQKAAEGMKESLGKKMFLSLVGDEKRHVEIFQQMAAEAGVRPAGMDEIDQQGPIARIAGIFQDVGRKVKKEIKPDDDDIKVIEVAKGMEEKAYFFYVDVAKSVNDAAEKDILLKIAEEENEHFRILEDTRMYLTYPKMWHIIQERPVIDGG